MESNTIVQATGSTETAKRSNGGRAALAMMPFTPVPFQGPDSFWAYARLAAYGAGAYAAFSKHRKLSYLLMGAGAVSAATSMSAAAWNLGKAQ